jgi:hypothetical protein
MGTALECRTAILQIESNLLKILLVGLNLGQITFQKLIYTPKIN